MVAVIPNQFGCEGVVGPERREGSAMKLPEVCPLRLLPQPLPAKWVVGGGDRCPAVPKGVEVLEAGSVAQVIPGGRQK